MYLKNGGDVLWAQLLTSKRLAPQVYVSNVQAFLEFPYSSRAVNALDIPVSQALLTIRPSEAYTIVWPPYRSRRRRL